MKWLATSFWLIGIAASLVTAINNLIPIAVSCFCLAGFLGLFLRYFNAQRSFVKWILMVMALLATTS